MARLRSLDQRGFHEDPWAHEESCCDTWVESRPPAVTSRAPGCSYPSPPGSVRRLLSADLEEASSPVGRNSAHQSLSPSHGLPVQSTSLHLLYSPFSCLTLQTAFCKGEKTSLIFESQQAKPLPAKDVSAGLESRIVNESKTSSKTKRIPSN